MSKLFRSVVALVLFGAFTTSASATIITFENTPNDPVGSVFTTNNNDVWDSGRGFQFGLSADTIIDSFGVFQDLTRIDMAYEIFDVTNGVILRSGTTGLTSTTGLEWVDVSFADLTLFAGNTYHMEFSFSGNSNQNFFHVEGGGFGGDPGYLSESTFTNINSTAGGPGATANFVLAKFRVNTTTAVSEPGVLALMLMGVIMIVARRIK